MCRDLTLVVLRRFTTKSDMVLAQAPWRDPSLDVLPLTTENAPNPERSVAINAHEIQILYSKSLI
jgi:hypothetical protein